jgi:transcription initiation factor IIE alpha subunit
LKVKCPDCSCEFEIDNEYRVGEVTTCPCCGLELELTAIVSVTNNITGEVKQLSIEGEDWGE